jgi:hypothetical protein
MATATATDLRVGKKNRRLEAMLEAGLDAAVTAVAKELAGDDGNPKMFRSEAARVLLAEAVQSRAAKAARASKA